MEDIKNLLLSRNIRPSHQRLQILKFLAGTPLHPTVGEIHQTLAPLLPTITKATIYNTLRLFVDKGLVSAFRLSGEEARFDYKHRLHAHFHCILCDKIIDIHSKYPCLDIHRIGPLKIGDVLLVFKGLCDKCQKPGKTGGVPLRKKIKKKVSTGGPRPLT